ncbi:MAG: SOS response-associated peptidase [Acidobacteriaceae bacterium]
MCGRVAFRSSRRKLEEAFAAELTEEFAPRYNLAPTEAMPVVVQEEERRVLKPMRWGFVTPTALLINARAESIANRPAFAEAFRRRRCLIAADAFYEWKRSGRVRQPFLIELSGGQTFGLAGIWECADVARCCIITTECNDLLRPIHDRMPVIVPQNDYAAWLNPAGELSALKPLLKPFPAEEMQMYPVSTAVNRAGYDGADCVVPVREAQTSLF